MNSNAIFVQSYVKPRQLSYRERHLLNSLSEVQIGVLINLKTQKIEQVIVPDKSLDLAAHFIPFGCEMFFCPRSIYDQTKNKFGGVHRVIQYMKSYLPWLKD